MPKMTRAQFLSLSALAAPAWAIARPWQTLAQTADDVRARVAEIIKAYDSQGIHRTATDTDNQSGRWLLDQATRAGGQARLEPFPLERVDIRAAVLRGDGRAIDGLPFFDGTFTDGIGLTGRLGIPAALTEFALVRLDQAAISSEGQSIAALRRSPSHKAIVAVTEGGTPGLSPSNAVAFAKPYGVPVLQVGSEHQAWLGAQAESGAVLSLLILAERTPATAQNVVVTVPGQREDLPPLVVMTPRSGWWHCASERGGGIACWLEIIRALSAARPVRPALFVASSGHELGHHGLDAFVKARESLVKNARAWIHLGANIGAANGTPRLQSADDAIEREALASLESAGAPVPQRAARGSVPGGEARNIHLGGGRYISMLGSGPRFHNEKDRWPDAVNVDAVAHFAQAFANLALELTRT